MAEINQGAKQYHQGLVYLRAKKYREAREKLLEAIDSDPGKGMYYYSLAVCCMQVRDFFEARKYFVRGHQNDTNHPLLLLFSVLNEEQLSLISSESPLKGEIFTEAAAKVFAKRPDLFASFKEGNTADILNAIFTGSENAG